MNKKYVLILVVLVMVGSYFYMAKGQSDQCVVGAKEVNELKDNKDIVLLDVRTPQEYASGHVQDAKLIDISNPSFGQEIDKLDKNKEYYVYCRTGARSARAQSIMQSKGFKHVCNVNGGILKLQQNGVAIVR